MTVTYRAWMLAAGAATISILVADSAIAQSFYEAITAVARTDAPKSGEAATTRRVAQPFETVTTPAGESSIAASPLEQTTPHRANPAVTKEDGYRYTPMATKNAKAWPNSEVQIARARCNFILRQLKAEVVVLDPIKNGDCGDPAPVKLVSVGTKPKVALDPPALVNCDMVQSLHDWVVNELQPSARRHLKSPITSIETMSSYSCRNAYGRKKGRLSQHGRANAIDIRGFRTAKKQKMHLLAHWGPTQRDINASRLASARRKAKRQAARAAASVASKEQQAVASRSAAAKSAEASVAAQQPAKAASMPRFSFRPSFGSSANGATKSALGAAPSRLGGPAVAALVGVETSEEPSWPVLLVSDRVNMSKASTPKARFLRDAHRTACKLFGTVLGPEANRAHRNHFHVDLARRDLGNFCR